MIEDGTAVHPGPARNGMDVDQLFPNARPAASPAGPPLCALAVDAEEDFDWDRPGYPTGWSTASMKQVIELHTITASYRLKPIYLLTYPVLQDAEVVQIIRAQCERDLCDVGIQLHPWVTPPAQSARQEETYLGQLAPAVVESKFRVLFGAFQRVFGTSPRVFRAGRYGFSATTARLLEEHGIEIDTSLAPRTDMTGEGGPDFSGFDSTPFWFGARREMLEMPLCRDLAGWGMGMAPALYRLAGARGPGRHWFSALLSRSRCAERITLSPEGNDAAAMRRLLRSRVQRGQRVFTLSFHSSSLAPGRNPYVRSRADLHLFYDRLSETLDLMAREGFGFVPLPSMAGLLRPAS